MPNKVIVGQLERKFARLKGEFETAEQQVEGICGLKAITETSERIEARKAAIREALGHITAVIRLFKEDWDPTKIDPIYPRQGQARKGDIAREAFRVLRISRVALRSSEIAHRIAERTGQPRDAQNISRIASAVHSALSHRIGTHVFLHSETPRCWALFPLEGEVLPSRDRAASSPPMTSKGAVWQRPGRPKRTASRY